MGLLARSVYGIATYRQTLIEPNLSTITQNISLKPYKSIESSLQHLKRAGLGLLGKLGFSKSLQQTKTKHPGNNNKIVIFIIGGISMNEIRQVSITVQELLKQSIDCKDLEIIIGSNQIYIPDTILHYAHKINC